MRRPFVTAALVFLAACSSLDPEVAVVPRGRLVLAVEPNPIVAAPLGGDQYELKFDIVMREEGGVGVRIENFTVDAVAFGTVTVQTQTLPAKAITDRGYPASVEAGKYLRFSFTKVWTLKTELLLSGASARVTANFVDENGVRGVTHVRVDVVRPPR
ncbi:MAG: hypothetical protein WA208_07555 [Thermoanaerobaculia bacterium]